jgi:hypothetical protein
MTLAICALLGVIAAAVPPGPEHARLIAMAGTR